MPQIEKPQFGVDSGPEPGLSVTLGQHLDFVTGFLRRRYLSILICLVLSLPVGGLYLFLAPATYTGSATMMIESQKNVLHESLLGAAPPDAGWIESQIGILRSLNVAAYVVKQLRLAEDPEFARFNDGLFDKILARLGWTSSAAKSEADRVGEAVSALMSRLDVRRIGGSYMLRIDVRGGNPEQAAKIANAMIDGYIFDQLNAKYQANRRAGDWLQERLQTLREQASAAERAVIDFKVKNNIVSVSGTLMSDKQLSEMSSELAAARAQTAGVETRLERIRAVREAYQQEHAPSAADETVSEAMGNSIITGLRTRYLDLVNREVDWSVKYGKNHVAVANLRNQIRDIRKSIRDELGRIEETSRSEYEIAKRRQEGSEKALASLVSRSTETNQAQVTLFALKSSAQSYRKLYDSFLQRHTEVVQQQSFPISDARPISAASAGQTGPQTLRTWLLTILAGGMLGVGVGAFREIRDREFRTRQQIQTVLGTECLALVPLLTDSGSKRDNRRLRGQTLGKLESRRNGVPAAERMFAAEGQASRRFRSTSRLLRDIVNAPASPYTEAIRSIKLTLDLRGPNNANGSKVIGLTSCLPSEGKSSIAVAMAALMGQSGARVILVDSDLRNPSLSRALAPDAKVGFVDVMAGNAALSDAVRIDPVTNLHFLPMVINHELPNATEMLATEAAKSLFVALQIKYDYVIVDLAPLIAAMDLRAISRLIEHQILVIEWGSTTVDAVQYALRNVPGVQDNIVGAVLNKVDMSAMRRYDSYGAKYYYGPSAYAGARN